MDKVDNNSNEMNEDGDPDLQVFNTKIFFHIYKQKHNYNIVRNAALNGDG